MTFRSRSLIYKGFFVRAPFAGPFVYAGFACKPYVFAEVGTTAFDFMGKCILRSGLSVLVIN